MRPATGLTGLLARLLSNDGKDLFMVRLGVKLLLGNFGIVGPLAEFIGYFLRGILGLIVDDGLFLIDLQLDAYREGAKLKEFEKEAKAAYEKATAKIYDEEKKNEIRQQYLRIIAKMGAVGRGPK